MRDNKFKTSPIKQRILLFAENLGISKREFYTSIGVSRGTLESKTSITEDVINKFLNAYPLVNILWLMTGEGDMYKQLESDKLHTTESSFGTIPTLESDQHMMKQHPSACNSSLGAPYYNIDFIGEFDKLFDNPSNQPSSNIIIPEFNKGTIWCNISGHSMEPKINHGDIVALRECTLQDIQFGEIYAIVMDTFQTIKIIRRGQIHGTLQFVPLNTPNFEAQEFPIDRIKRIYKVIGVICKFF